MKRFLILSLFLVLSFSAFSQVINFAKTLPVSAYSFSLAGVQNMSSTPYQYLLRGPAFVAHAGYGIGYDVDIELKYGYYMGTGNDVSIQEVTHYIGADLQYLFRETRNSYFSFHGGLHKWEEYGVDATVTYTYTPEYWLNLSAGLDLDLDISVVELRGWIPLNVGINFDDRYYIFAEYDLPVNEFSWDIVAVGVTFILR